MTDSTATSASALPTGLRIRGHIVATHGDGGVVLVRATMRDPKGVSHRLEGPSARLRTDAGTTIALEWPPAEELVAVPTMQVAGSFREVSDHPLASPWRDRNRDHGARVEIDGLALRAGDLVEIYGEPAEQTFAEHHAGLRDAPSSTVTAVRVRIIAGGKSPRTAMDEALGAMFPALGRPAKRPADPRIVAIVAALVATVGLASALIGFVLGPFALAIDGVLGALGFLGIALLLFQSPRYPQFILGAENTKQSNDPALIAIGTFGLITHAAFTVSILWTDAERTSETGARAFTGVVVFVLFTLAITRVLVGLNSVDAAMGLLKAVPIPARFKSNTVGSICGIVRDPSPVKVRGELVALQREHDIEVVGGSDPNIVRTTVHNRETFLVETSDAIYEVDPVRAYWASAIVKTTPTKAGRMEREIVPIGARILMTGSARHVAAGMPARIERVAGDDPVRFYATRSDGDPREELERMCRAHWRCSVGLALLALAALSVGVAASGRLPPEHHSEAD